MMGVDVPGGLSGMNLSRRVSDVGRDSAGAEFASHVARAAARARGPSRDESVVARALRPETVGPAAPVFETGEEPSDDGGRRARDEAERVAGEVLKSLRVRGVDEPSP